jgi:hypothetical protein
MHMQVSASLKGSLAVLAAVLMLGGCAAQQKMSDADRAKFKTAQVGEVKKGQAYILAPGKSLGLMFGAVGGAATGGAVESDTKIFDDFLAKHGIQVEKIAREELEAALRESGKLQIVAPGEAGAAVLSIEVAQYGFGVPTLVSSTVVPVIYVKAQLADGAGKPLWADGERLLPSIANPIANTTWEALQKDPKLCEAKLREAARIVSKKLVAGM